MVLVIDSNALAGAAPPFFGTRKIAAITTHRSWVRPLLVLRPQAQAEHTAQTAQSRPDGIDARASGVSTIVLG